jgi:hypothetical protein
MMDPQQLRDIPRKVIARLSESFARRHGVLPVAVVDRELQIAYAFDRYPSAVALAWLYKKVRQQVRGKFVLAPLRQADVEDAIARHYLTGEINACGLDVVMQYRCPLQWRALTQTDDPLVRYCDECQKPVYFCEDRGARIDHAKAGHCMAFEVPEDLGGVFMGAFIADPMSEDDEHEHD